MIKTAIRCPDDMVMVFDNSGEEMPEYQDLYKKVKESILKDAPPNAVFYHMFYSSPALRKVSREEW